MLKIKAQKYNSVLVSASSNKELCQTFMRFQEHYESPNNDFRNKVFTRGQYLAWYSETYGGATYHHDWQGFNFPSKVLEPFRKGLFDPLTSNEKELINLLKYRHDDFYIIGANDDSIIRHELAHALYSYSKSYSEQINRLFGANKKKISKSLKYILDKGYTKEVLFDELQAYLTDNDDEYLIKHTPQIIIDKTNLLYKKYSI